MIDPRDCRQFRLALAYERTERRGPVFDRLREDVDTVAAMQGMQDVFRLRAADIYRVLHVDAVPARPPKGGEAPGFRPEQATERAGRATTARLAQLSARLGRCPILDAVVATAVDGLAELFGYGHSLLMLLDESGTRLYTIASHGYEVQGVGSEVAVGQGIIGMSAARCVPLRLGNVGQVAKYGRTVRSQYEQHGDIGPGREVPMPGLTGAQSRVAVPALALGQLVGVLVVDSPDEVAFTEADEALLRGGGVDGRQHRRDRAEQVRYGREHFVSPAKNASVIGIGPSYAGALLPRRRQHLHRRGVPHQRCSRPAPVVSATTARERRAGGVHQPRGPPRPLTGTTWFP